MATPSDNPDTLVDPLLEKFPMFLQAWPGSPAYTWSPPKNTAPLAAVVVTQSNETRLWYITLSIAHERHLGVPPGTYDQTGFETAEAAMAYLLLNGVVYDYERP